MNRISSFAPLTTIFAVAFAPMNMAHAEDAKPDAPPQAIARPDRKRQVFVKIRNVKPSTMAWWIDPKNNEIPIDFRVSRANASAFPSEFAPKDDPAKPIGDVGLPNGVDRVVSIDPQNALLVFGSDAGIAELQKTIAVLDKPLRQVEIEVRYVQIGVDDMIGLGLIKDPTLKYTGDLTAEVAPATIFIQISDLLAQNKASIIAAPRVRAINNAIASLRSETTGSAVLAFKDKDGNLNEVLDTDTLGADQKIELSTTLGVIVKPTIHDDDTVDLMVAMGRTVRLKSGSATEPVISRNLDGVHSIGNIRDGQTIALVGANSRHFYLDDTTKAPANVMILITVKRVASPTN